jgi:hypothetical protein
MNCLPSYRTFLDEHDVRRTTACHSTPPPHVSRIVVTHYLNQQFPNGRIGRGGAQKWPPRSPDLNSLDYRVRGLREGRDVCTQGELDRRNTSAHCFVRLHVPGHTGRKMYPSRWRPFWITCISSELRTVSEQLTTTFSKHTVDFFFTLFIRLNVNTDTSVTFPIGPCVYDFPESELLN